jgi:K+-sensing histidine kinase KdpD
MDIGQSRYRAWLLAASASVPLVVAALLSLVRDTVSTATSVLVLVLVVVAASSTGVRLAGLAAALSSGVFFDLFLTQPYGALAVSNPDDVEALVLLLAVGAAVTELALWGRRQQAVSSRRLGYLDGVLSAAEKVAARDPDPADLLALVTTELTDVLGLDGCRYAPVAPHLRVVIQPDGQVHTGERAVDVQRSGLPTEEEILLPVRNAGQTVGGFVLTTASRIRRPTPEQLRVAVLLADQVGTVLTRPAGNGRGPLTQ